MVQVVTKIEKISADGAFTGQTISLRETKNNSDQATFVISKSGVNAKERSGKISLSFEEALTFVDAIIKAR